MNKRLYQNDFPELPGVEPTGCLFMSLLDIVSEELKQPLTREDVDSIYHLCNERGILGTPLDKKEKGAYVWDHVSVLDIASLVLGQPDVTWEYCARIYTQAQEAKGKSSFIFNKKYETESTYLIFQVCTTEVPGHFLRMSYNPWKYGSKEKYLKSVRYYRRKS